MKSYALLVIGLLFLGSGWFCYDIGYSAGIISADMGMIVNGVEPSVIVQINVDALSYRKEATFEAIGIDLPEEEVEVVNTNSL